MNAIDPNIVKSVPVNLEIEQGVLGAILVDANTFPAVAGILRPEHFSEPLHQQMFEVYRTMARDGRNPSAITIQNDLPADLKIGELSISGYIARLCADAWTVGDQAGSLAREIVRQWARRQVLSVSSEMMDRVCMVGANPEDVIALSETDLIGLSDELSRLQSDGSASGPAVVVKESQDRMQSGNRWKGPRCGIVAIDNLIGGFEAGDFVVLAARPSMGKSALALSLARRAAQIGVGVGFVSIEMGGAQVWRRLVSDECEAGGNRIAYTNIARGRVDPAQIGAMDAAAATLDQLPLCVVDTGNRLSDLPGHIRSMRQKLAKRGAELQILIVDYLGLLKPGNRYAGSRVNEVTEMTSTVKALAKREGITIFGLHQLNRANEGRDDYRPRLSELRDSGSLEQDADIVIFVHREEYYISRPGYRRFADNADKLAALTKYENEMEAIIAKQRNGPTGTCKLWCNMATNSVRDRTP